MDGSEVAALLRDAGWTGDDLLTMLAIAHRESRWNPQAHNPDTSTGDNSYGLFQINMLGSLGPSRRRAFGITSNDELFDPAVNVRAARVLWQWGVAAKGDGFYHWIGYRGAQIPAASLAAARAALEEASPMWAQAPTTLVSLGANGPAIDHGVNRYTRQPVNITGLTREAYELQQAILAAFPDSPTKTNYAVDRNQRGSTTTLSDHARGEAIDIIVQKHDGKLGVSSSDREWGDRLFDWLVATAKDQPVGRGLRGRAFRGPYRIYEIVWNGRIYYASENVVRPLKPSSLQHVDHIHISIVPVDRTGQQHEAEPTPPRDPHPAIITTRYGDTGDAVTSLQRALAKLYPNLIVDGQFGRQTRRYVKAFQRMARSHDGHTVVDGIAGPQTWRAIIEWGLA